MAEKPNPVFKTVKKTSVKKAEVFEFKPIGYVQSLFKTRFAVPRQPGLATEAKGIIQINPDPDLKIALRRLEEFSHIWIVFVFHDHGGKKWKPSIRPPRLGGQVKVGVLSSRSPHRPNPIGISAVVLEKIDFDSKDGVQLHVQGIDLIDGTPVLDIKPYVAYADSITNSKDGWAQEAPEKFAVTFSEEGEEDLKAQDPKNKLRLRELAVQILELDPRPAFQKRKSPVTDKISWGTKHGFSLLDFDITYEITSGGFVILGIKRQAHG